MAVLTKKFFLVALLTIAAFFFAHNLLLLYTKDTRDINITDNTHVRLTNNNPSVVSDPPYSSADTDNEGQHSALRDDRREEATIPSQQQPTSVPIQKPLPAKEEEEDHSLPENHSDESNSDHSESTLTKTPTAATVADTLPVDLNNKMMFLEFVDSLPIHPSKLKVIVIAYKRAKYLSKTLESLSNVLYANKENIIVFQYGNSEEINKIVAENGLTMYINPYQSVINGVRVLEGAEHIAYHYKYAFSKTFDLYPDLQHFIVVEDDMLFAPDFLLYFAQLARHMDRDPSIYCISAYNDNGFRGLARDENMVYRTEFFVGLGWLVSRKLYKEEWESRWPRSHWDHWLRDPAQRKGRECLFPDVSRVFHTGYIGTHSSADLYERYFRDIQVATKGFVLLGFTQTPVLGSGHPHSTLNLTFNEPLEYLYPDNYEKLIQGLLHGPDTIYISMLADLDRYTNKVLVIPYRTSASESRFDKTWEKVIAKKFKLWHALPIRGQHKGVTRIWWNTNHVLFVASYSPYWADLMKRHPGMTEFSDATLGSNAIEQRLSWTPPRRPSIAEIVVSKQGQSCSRACTGEEAIQPWEDADEEEMMVPNANAKTRSIQAECNIHFFRAINNCDTLRKYFPCTECDFNIGADQPAFEVNRGVCFVNSGTNPLHVTTCEGLYPTTKRLCACLDTSKYQVYELEWEDVIQNAKNQRKALELSE